MCWPPQLYSSTWGASARVTVVSVTCGEGAPTVVSFTVFPAVPRLPSASKGAHSRRCAGSVNACQTFSGEWRSSLVRTSVHFSPSFCTRAPLAGPGVYGSRSVIFSSSCSHSLSSFVPIRGCGGTPYHRVGWSAGALRRMSAWRRSPMARWGAAWRRSSQAVRPRRPSSQPDSPSGPPFSQPMETPHAVPVAIGHGFLLVFFFGGVGGSMRSRWRSRASR